MHRNIIIEEIKRKRSYLLVGLDTESTRSRNIFKAALTLFLSSINRS